AVAHDVRGEDGVALAVCAARATQGLLDRAGVVDAEGDGVLLVVAEAGHRLVPDERGTVAEADVGEDGGGVADGGEGKAGFGRAGEETEQVGVADEVPHHAEAADDEDAVIRAAGDVLKALDLLQAAWNVRVVEEGADGGRHIVPGEAELVERRTAPLGRRDVDSEAFLLEDLVRG